MKSLIYKELGVVNAQNFESMVSIPLANVYVMIGRSKPWANASNSQLLDDTSIETPLDNITYRNQIARDATIMRKLTANDLQLVAPRVDWDANTIYVAYDQSANLFVKSLNNVITGGNVNVTLALANTVAANGINLASLTPPISSGTLISIGQETKEVHFVTPNGSFLRVNTAFTGTYTAQTLTVITTSDTQYINKFYVRNSLDQVFKCLYNNNNAYSTIMPEITLDGQLPENPFIETSDGYKWKYMYTIPSGVKNKFFTDKYMPVITEPVVFDNAGPGRLDIVKILSAGSGYYGGGSVNNYPVVTVTGDGSGANVSVDVLNGLIVDVNILNGGNSYTTATLTINDPIKTSSTANANLYAVISPSFGHGANPVRELGASNLMISIDFEGDLGGELPTEADSSDTMRQICIVRDPQYANSAYAYFTYIPMFTRLIVSPPAVSFTHGSLIYSGSKSNPTFTARSVHFDDDTNELLINNISGNLLAAQSQTIYQFDNDLVAAKVITIDAADINIYSGQVLYVENRAKIIRSPDQTESLKLVLEF